MTYTPEQEKAVIRVMKLKITDYYGHLMIERSCTSIEIKKAYKKQALVVHPDKNHAPQSDEAFKRVSKAFKVLSDDTKRKIYDQTGADPDARGGMPGGGGGFARPPPGFGTSPFNTGSARFGNAFPADDIFTQFFGPAGAASAGGPGFQFQFADGGDIFSQLFGDALFGNAGGRRQQRQRQQAQAEARDQASEKFTSYFSLIIIIAVLVLPSLLGSLFGSGDSASKVPQFKFNPAKPYLQERFTPKYDIPFYVNPKDMDSMEPNKLKKLDNIAEQSYVNSMNNLCRNEYMAQQVEMQDSIGFFFTDSDRYDAAKNMPLPHCDILKKLGIRVRQ